MKNKKYILLFCLFFVYPFLANSAVDYERSVQDFRKTLAALVKAKMVNPPGNEARAVEILGARLKSEGIDYKVMEFAPGRSNLVARLKGSGKKRPLLLLAHTDVVGAENQDWSSPPYELTEKDGFLYGRGAVDDLSMAVANLETFLNLKREKVSLQRDVILAYTGDEESGGAGIQALLEKHPDWVDAEIALNEGGRVITDENEKPLYVSMSTAEKTYADFTLSVKGTTGHSSMPKGENAIFLLAEALHKLNEFKPQTRLVPATREYFRHRAQSEKQPELAQAMKDIVAAKGVLPKKAVQALLKSPFYAPLLMTTCVPTIIAGGIRANALPPDATVTVNCRVLPDEPVSNVKRRLEEIVQDSRIVVSIRKDMGQGGSSALTGVIPSAVQKITKEMYPEIPVISAMMNGATDSRFLRNRDVQVYGLSPFAIPEMDTSRSHGADERLPVKSIRPGLEYQYRLVVELVQ